MAKTGFWLRGARGKFAGASLQKGADGSTIMREIVTPTNPQTISQVIQRMKAAPAQKFYNALSELLSNAFQGVKYGNDSRLRFLSLAMKMNGPYVQKGVDRFIPAAYPFTRGSMPTIGILPFDGGATKFSTDVDGSAATFAEGLGVTTDTQFTICIVRNNSGMFVPEYIPFETRMTLDEIPTGGIIKEDSTWKIVPSAFGFNDTNIVAIAVAVSVQQADGSWLRSNQDMVISNQLEAQLYSQSAMNAAIASYQDGADSNSINSAWYYNLGLNQAFNGQVVPMVISINGNSVRVLMGITQVAGRPQYTIFATSSATTGNIIEVNGRNCVASTTTVADLIAAGITYPVAEYSEAIAIQAGLNNEVNTTSAAVFYLREWQNNIKLLVDKDGKLVLFNGEGEGDPSQEDFYTVYTDNGTWNNAEGTTEAPWYNTQLLTQWGYKYYVGDHSGPINTITATEEGKEPTEYVINVNNNTAVPEPAPFA